MVLHSSLSMWFRINDCQLQYRRLPHNVYSDMLFATTVCRRGNKCAECLPPNFVGHAYFQWRWKAKPMRHCPFSFSGMGCHMQQYVTMPKKWSLACSKGNSRRHHVTLDRQAIHLMVECIWDKIKNLKKGYGRKLIKSGTPKKLWDDFPGFWILHKAQYCAWHLQTRLGSSQDDYV